MKIDFSRKAELLPLILAGAVASGISFLYYYALKNPSVMLLWLLYAVDIILFVISAYHVVASFEMSRFKTVTFTVVAVVGFFIFCVIVFIALTSDSDFEYTDAMFREVIRIGVFLSPSFILLIPVMWLVAEIIS